MILKELIDDIGLYVTVFSEPAFKSFYEAAMKVYIRTAPRKEPARFSDVLMELESTGDGNTDLWKSKYASKENENHNHKLAARVLMNEFLRVETASVLDEWRARLDRTESVREDIASLVSLLVNLTTDGTIESRPSNILQQAWKAGVREPEPTGFDALNRVWGGGYRPQWLMAIGMPSGMGKTSSAVSFMCERVRQGRYTLFNSFEQSSVELLFKAICNLSGVLTLDQVEKPDRIGTTEEWNALKDSESLLDKYVRIYDSACKLEELPVRVRRHQAEFGPQMDFVVVDHIGIVDSSPTNGAAQWSRGLEQTAYSLKNNVSKAYNVCTLIYSQVPPDVEKQLKANNRTNSDALRGSSGIKPAVDILAIGCKHNSIRDVMCLQTTKARRDGTQSYVGLRYDAAHHRLLNQEVQL